MSSDIVDWIDEAIRDVATSGGRFTLAGLAAILGDAKAEIERLRQITGAANVGQSFREMKDSDVLGKFVGEG